MIEEEVIEYLGFKTSKRGKIMRGAKDAVIIPYSSQQTQADSGMVVGWEVATKNNKLVHLGIWRPEAGNKYRSVGCKVNI